MNAGCEVGGKGDALVQVAREHFWQMLFINRDFAALKLGDFGLVVVHAEDAVAHLCKADGGDEADIAGADDADGDGG